MQLIKPQRKCVNLFNRKNDPDAILSFYYCFNEKMQRPKRTYRISMNNFFYRTKFKWQYINFGIEHGTIVFFEGDKLSGYKFNNQRYICNMSLIETICDVYNIKIKDKAFNVNFKCDQINDKMWRLIKV